MYLFCYRFRTTDDRKNIERKSIPFFYKPPHSTTCHTPTHPQNSSSPLIFRVQNYDFLYLYTSNYQAITLKNSNYPPNCQPHITLQPHIERKERKKPHLGEKRSHVETSHRGVKSSPRITRISCIIL
jgi:hypothetical protein